MKNALILITAFLVASGIAPPHAISNPSQSFAFRTEIVQSADQLVLAQFRRRGGSGWSNQNVYRQQQRQQRQFKAGQERARAADRARTLRAQRRQQQAVMLQQRRQEFQRQRASHQEAQAAKNRALQETRRAKAQAGEGRRADQAETTAALTARSAMPPELSNRLAHLKNKPAGAPTASTAPRSLGNQGNGAGGHPPSSGNGGGSDGGELPPTAKPAFNQAANLGKNAPIGPAALAKIKALASTSKANQSAKPRNLQEQVFWNSVKSNPAGGKDLPLDKDPAFPPSKGWQKKHQSHRLPDGKAIVIHYQYNAQTNTVVDLKIAE